MALKQPSWKHYTSLMLTFHWPELSHMATPRCRRGWEIWHFFFFNSLGHMSS